MAGTGPTCERSGRGPAAGRPRWRAARRYAPGALPPRGCGCSDIDRGRHARVIDRDAGGRRFVNPNASVNDGSGGIYFSASGDFAPTRRQPAPSSISIPGGRLQPGGGGDPLRQRRRALARRRDPLRLGAPRAAGSGLRRRRRRQPFRPPRLRPPRRSRRERYQRGAGRSGRTASPSTVGQSLSRRVWRRGA
jgi:hypothetical protein